MTITKEQWYQHPEFRQELEEILKNPTLRAALDLIRAQGLRSTLEVPGVNLIHYFALQGARKDGYMEALTNLEILSMPQPAKGPDRKPWTNPTPPAEDKTPAK